METQFYETRSTQRATRFPAISWGAIFAGLASGLAVQLLLTLFGIAAGLSALNPEAAEPMGRIPLMAVIWTGISLILAAFVGGFVAARMSGFSRLADGLLHGMVAWGISTVIFAYALTTSVGSLIGGAFSIAGQGAKAVAGGVAASAGGVAGSQSAQTQLESLLKGTSGGGEVSKESLAALQQRLSAGDRDGAMDVMVNQMGFTQERAAQVLEKGSTLFGAAQNAPQQAREVATSAVSGLSKASWGLFVALLLSMILGIFGGAVGSRTALKRRHPLVHSH
ncbi:hypothetical protein [Geobacter sp. SVR]|uniref:hypothetical protein n=1 Tax=Geobacter sp. SVR TaxID=2495594 RepID=UPI00143EF93D|nr:hypothetical protein [Geobacter sp. SVR]BCS52548.1 hypothetical protein GSVR_08560 [Geobacter sp. SVR]GCF84014.1 hypothetical protein GSbR_06140 [Geobacter sp. SVR]